MGLPALRLSHETRHARPHLRVVRPSTASRRRRCHRADSSREIFALTCVLLAGLALFGLGRVMLASRATEASIRSSALREEIKAEQLVGDMLEIDKSALAVPSRIENIAGNSMQMSDAVSVEYMELPADVQDATGEEPAGVALTAEPQEDESAADAPDGLLASILEMAAGEAQVLLVGDVGLASSE